MSQTSCEQRTFHARMIPPGPVPQNFFSHLTQPDQVPSRELSSSPSSPPGLLVGLILLRARNSLVAPGEPHLRCSPELPNRALLSHTLSSQLPPPDHTASFLIQPEKEEHVMQTKCEHSTQSPSSLTHKKAHWGILM